MSDSMEKMIKLPGSLKEKVAKFAKSNELSQHEAIIQLLDLALSQESQMPFLKGKLPLDSKNDDC
jgi:hypothetical protein